MFEVVDDEREQYDCANKQKDRLTHSSDFGKTDRAGKFFHSYTNRSIH